MDSEKYLKELLKWVSTESLLVIDGKGHVRRIFCPFNAISLAEFPGINMGEKVAVEAVKITLTLKEVYIIKGNPYFIFYFRIII